MHILSPTLLTFFTLVPLAFASGPTNKNSDGSCSQSDNQLQLGTYQLTSDCSDTNFCNDQGQCTPRGCRRDEFPLGYPQGATLPPRCRPDEFCPDEGDKCQPLLPVGSPCQLNRDDECAAPPNFRDIADKNSNHNGSVCLNFQCMWANVTLGQTCIVEQMPYIAYGVGSAEFVYVVSRGNCIPGLYCDAGQKICMQEKAFGASCTADKECQSNNCLENLTCGDSPSAPKHFGVWVYAVVGVGILLGMVGTLTILYLFHRKTREAEREKRTQYWREQSAFRQNILQMRDTAKASLLSLSVHGSDTPRSTFYHGGGHGVSEDNGLPMMRRVSGFRPNTADSDGRDSSIHGETPMLLPAEQEGSGWPAGRKLSSRR